MSFEDQIRAQTGNYDISNEQIVQQVESLQDKATRIALDHKISTSTLFNLIDSESEWNPEAISPTGDYGLVQISLDYWHVTKQQAFDPEFALEFAANKIEKGQEYLWTVCSCVKYARTLVKGVPSQNASKFVPNTSVPHVGHLAIFHYSKGISHVAVVTAVNKGSITVSEANFTPCKTASRVVDISDPHLIGYWDASV